jgi:hypothetical protein
LNATPDKVGIASIVAPTGRRLYRRLATGETSNLAADTAAKVSDTQFLK